ncbi:MAG: cysteate synthase [Bacteroidales bacterium]
MKKISKTNYRLRSIASGAVFDDEGWTLEAPDELRPGLIRALYEKKQIDFKDPSLGIYRFADWLPVNNFLEGSSAPVTYKSEGLAGQLGLTNLYITFSGYWPEKDAFMNTCSFKETEAFSVCGRLNHCNSKVLVVASAGNTSRSFARVCSDHKIPLLICVPEDNTDALWFDAPIDENYVKLIVSRTGSDYFDAIYLSNIACRHPDFIPEGGAKNIARRDGMGTTVLSAVEHIGRIPEYYFQAIGSGTGAIAAWEASLRLLEDGRFGTHKMKLMVSQNHPFTPIMDSWLAGSRDILPMNDEEARGKVEKIMAKVLSNRKPPYALAGGLYDALKDAGGEVLAATNREAEEAGRLFEEIEGIDLHPAASVATATLIRAVKDQKVDKDSLIMLNITGGGEKKFMSDKALYYLKPSEIFDMNPTVAEVHARLDRLF